MDIPANRSFPGRRHLHLQLVLSSHSDNQDFISEILQRQSLGDDRVEATIARIVAGLLNLPATAGSIAAKASDILLTCFAKQLQTIGLAVVLDLLRHPLPELQVCGGSILTKHQTPASELPPGLIETLIESPNESLQAIGVELFGKLPDETLLQRIELIVSFANHRSPRMREAMRPSIRRLASNPAHSQQFTADLIDRLLTILLQAELYPGSHNGISQILQADLGNWMENTSQATAWKFLAATSTSAQEIGGKLLAANADR
jgi:hypothetical protein